MALALRYAARSDVGLVRPGNEDSGYAGPHVLVVADGMGGHAAGELASAAAVATFAAMDEPTDTAETMLPALAGAVRDAGATIGRVITDEPDLTGMGTTVTAMVWDGAGIAMAHVGDSRAYRLRDGVLQQLTHDHTYVQTLVDAGRITPEEALTHPRRSLIMRAIDGMTPVEPDLSVEEVLPGDRLLLCSDGLSGVVHDDDLARLLAGGDPTGTVGRLVEAALERGAPDNVTVVVADVVEVPDEELGAEQAAGGDPVVVGAAGEPRVRARLPRVQFPEDAQPDPDRPDPPPPVEGPPTSPQPAVDAPAPPRMRVLAPVRSRPWLRVLAWVGLVGLVIALVAMLLLTWLRAQWYVGAADGSVVVYQGVPGALLGVPLQQVERTSDVSVASLPVFAQELVGKGIPASDKADASRIIDELRRQAAACAVPRPTAGCPTTATPSPGPTGAATGGATVAPAPTPAASAGSPAPLPTATLGATP